MPGSIKKTISLPAETYRKAESYRRRSGVSRSEFVAEALEAYFARQERAELEARDEIGYRNHPEDAQEAEAWLKAALTSWGPREDW